MKTVVIVMVRCGGCDPDDIRLSAPLGGFEWKTLNDSERCG